VCRLPPPSWSIPFTGASRNVSEIAGDVRPCISLLSAFSALRPLPQEYIQLNLLPSHAPPPGPQSFYPPLPPSSSLPSSAYPSLLKVAAANIMCGGLHAAGKTVVKMELQLPQDSSFAYQPGDSIGIFPPNSDDDVQLLLERCCSPPSAGFELPTAAPAPSRGIINSEAFLKWGVDLRVCVTKKILRELSCWCSDAAEGDRLLQVPFPLSTANI
jgi:sulfite reductase alpha subunit-like flavoprotein